MIYVYDPDNHKTNTGLAAEIGYATESQNHARGIHHSIDHAGASGLYSTG